MWPSIDAVVDYSPKLPLRVLSADGVEIAQFGTERLASLMQGTTTYITRARKAEG